MSDYEEQIDEPSSPVSTKPSENVRKKLVKFDFEYVEEGSGSPFKLKARPSMFSGELDQVDIGPSPYGLTAPTRQ